MKHNDGFTLVEMLVAIVAGTIVTAAAATVLLLGMRMNAHASKMTTRQNQVRIGLTVLGTMAKENANIGAVTTDSGWEVKSGDEVLYTYDSGDHTISTKSDVVLLENVTASTADYDDKLLTIKITIDGETYQSAVYCPVTGST